MSTVLHHGSQHGCLSRATTPGEGGGTNLPVEHLVADDQAGGSADGLCEEVGGRGGGGHSGEMAGDLGEAREHPEGGGGNAERSSWERGVVGLTSTTFATTPSSSLHLLLLLLSINHLEISTATTANSYRADCLPSHLSSRQSR